jgi:hypothetical protein
MEVFYAVIRSANGEYVTARGALDEAQFCAGHFPPTDPVSIVAYEYNAGVWTKQSDGSTPSDDIIAALEADRIYCYTALGEAGGVPWTVAKFIAENQIDNP